MYLHVEIMLFSIMLKVLCGTRNPRKVVSIGQLNSQSALEENFPVKFSSAWTYFTKPLNKEPAKTSSKQTSDRKMLTLAEVSHLFETYFSSLQKYSKILKDDNDRKKVFIKIIEDVNETGIDIHNINMLKIFLQIRMATYSRSVNNLTLDSFLYNRYNSVVTDLLSKKQGKKQKLELSTPHSTTIKTMQETNDKYKRRKVRWRPGRTPNSPIIMKNKESAADEKENSKLEYPFKTGNVTNPGMNAENLEIWPHTFENNKRLHLSSSPFLLTEKETADVLESPFLVTNPMKYGQNQEQTDNFNESDFQPLAPIKPVRNPITDNR